MRSLAQRTPRTHLYLELANSIPRYRVEKEKFAANLAL